MNRTKAISAALCASLSFGFGNLAYRYGNGNALAIAGQRCLVGLLLMLPFVIRSLGSVTLTKLVHDRNAIIAMLASGIQLVVTAVLLRSLSGPQAGLAIATMPLVVLAIRRFFVQHKPAPLLPLAVCVLASATATLSGGLGHITLAKGALTLLFIFCNSIDILCAERARATQSSAVLVAGGMAAGMIIGYGAEIIIHPSGSISTSGFIAAGIVGVMGTLGRFLRGYSLPIVGSAIMASTSQISALITAVGGIILLSDSFRTYALALALIAAIASAYAVLKPDPIRPLSPEGG